MQHSNPSSAKPKHAKPKLFWIPLTIFIVGICIATYLEQQQSLKNQQYIQSKLRDRLAQISAVVVERVTFYQYGLRGLRGAVLANGVDEFDYANMQSYSRSRDNENEFPGARGFGLIRYVNSNQVTEFVQHARQDRPDKTFKIRQLNPHEDSLFVIQYIEPEQHNRQAVGLDIGSESVRRQAAIKAANHNEVRLSAPITLVQASSKTRHGFLMLMPIYRSIPAPQTIAARMADIQGWSYAPLLIDEVLLSVNALNNDLILNITDISGATDTTFYQFGQLEQGAKENKVTDTINLFGRNWELELFATPEFIKSLLLPTNHQIFLTALGVTIVLMLIAFSLLLTLARREQAMAHKAELSLVTQHALLQANKQLEQEVSKRIKQISQVSVLQRSILHSAGYAIIATNEVGIVTAFNPAAETLLGYSADELIGKPIPVAFHVIEEVIARAKVLSTELNDQIQPGFEVIVAKARLGHSDTNPWTYVHKSGRHIPVRLNVNSLIDLEGNIFGFLGIAYDLTEQLEHERVLAQAIVEAEQANEAKSKFLANMSHEIRTPLHGIYGTLQILEKQASSELNRELLKKALYSSKILNIIINDILDFSKIEAGKLVLENCSFNLPELLEYLRSDLSMIACQKGILFDLSNHVEHQDWQGDPTRLRQILLNIASNALKFTHVGSVVLTVNYLASKGHLVFTLKDTGIGIDKAQQHRLFQRFEQSDTSTTRKFGGTGLGLSITHSLVTLMGGNITVASELGKGSTFSVMLPLHKAVVKDLKPKLSPSEHINLAGRTILIAEDNEINQMVVESMLAPTQATLIFTSNGREAVAAQHQNALDLILMDIQMPEMDGIAACRQIKSTHPDTPIIALTANAMPEDIKLYEREGFDGYIAKPVELSLLLEKLRAILLC